MSGTEPVRNSVPVNGPLEGATLLDFGSRDLPLQGTDEHLLRDGVIWVFPGLGCRFVGMGGDLFDQIPEADELFGDAEAWLGYSLQEVCLEGSGRKIVPATQEAQVIYVVSCAYGMTLQSKGFAPAGVAGHSLGNWAAGWMAGLYDFQTGLDLVTHVEELLQEIVPAGTQTMGVVIGLDESVVREIVESESEVQIANWNSPGQYIIGGDARAVDAVLSAAIELKAKRARRLPTDRALHTRFMKDVARRVRERLAEVRFSEPIFPFISSDTSAVLRSAEEARNFLGDFLENPVHWEPTMRRLCGLGVRQFVEVGPGNVLTSMFPFIERTANAATASELLEQGRAQ